MNIIWKKPDNTYAVTEISANVDVLVYANNLLTNSVVPPTWVIYGTNLDSITIQSLLTEKTIQDKKNDISTAIQKLLDDKAKSLRYDSILSARSYAGYVNPFQAEALKLADWAANCWAMAGSIEAQVNAGTMTMPTVDQALAMMPAYI